MGPAVVIDMLSNAAGNTFSVPRLRDDGSNWVDYESKIRTALGSKGLIKHIEGTAIKPLPLLIESGVPVSKPGTPATESEIESREKRIDEFEQREYMSQHVIQSTVSPRLGALIRSKTPADMWRLVKADATDKSDMYKVEARRKLQEMRCDDNSDIRAHLNSMSRARDELSGMGASLDDATFVTIILGSMPESYRTLLSSIMQSARAAGRTVPSSDLMAIILEESAYRHSQSDRDRSKSTESALQASKSKGRKGPKSNVKCENCAKLGHSKADCFGKGGGKEGQAPWQKKKQQGAAKATAESDAKAETPSESSAYAFVAVSQAPTGRNVAAASRQGRSAPEFIVDSGATSHFCPDRARFTNYKSLQVQKIYTADGRALSALGCGDVAISLPNGATTTPVTLKDVLHVPDMETMLISIWRLDSAGFQAKFGRGVCTIAAPDGKIIGQIPGAGGLYTIADTTKTHHAGVAFQRLSLAEAHRTLGHVGHQAIVQAVRNGLIVGIELDGSTNNKFCEACAKAKPHRKPFPTQAKNRAQNFGERVHADLWGPASIESLGHKRYSLDFTDDATRYTDISFLSRKDQSLEEYKAYDRRVETQEGTIIKAFRSDRGGEFNNDEFASYLKSRGTHREFTVHDTHEQVGVAERLNRTKVELARAMLFDAKLPMFLWAEAMHHAIWIKNRSPTRALDGMTPFEARYGTKPDLSALVPFGTRAWVKIMDAGKLEPRAKLGFFVGFDDESTGFRIYYPDKRTVNPEREVTFDRLTRDEQVPIDATPAPNSIPTSPDTNMPNPTHPPTTATTTMTLRPRSRAANEPGYYRSLHGIRPRNTQAQVALSDDEFHHYALASALETGPATLNEALAGPHASEWQAAWDAELAQLEKRGTWKIVPRPKDKPVIPCKPVLREKPGPDGRIERRKVRLVAGGHKQQKGINYDDTFATAAKINSIRAILALAADRDWEIDQVDVVGAYLNSELEEEVYMEAPKGVLPEGEKNLVCRLLKALYGLKQSGRAWYRKMLRDFLEMGFVVSLGDQSVFIRKTKDGILVVPVSTDDMVVAGTTRLLVNAFKKELGERYEITDGGEIHWLLGFEVRRNRSARTISLNQRAYLESMANRFELADAKPVWTPMEVGAVLSKDQCPTEPIRAPYQEACGHVLWPAIISRPDVQFAVGLLARFMQNPAEVHWAALKRVMRYLYTTRDLWLTLGGGAGGLEGFCDADWAMQLDRHSVSGYVFRIGGGAITWSSKRQSIVALSTAEAEYIAAVHAAKEAMWLRILLNELDAGPNGAVVLRCDNQSAIALCKDSKFHARTKHFDIRYHFIREAVENRSIAISYIPSDQNIADILTKALARPKFELLLKSLGLRALA
jgi:hypothetical protein